MQVQRLWIDYMYWMRTAKYYISTCRCLLVNFIFNSKNPPQNIYGLYNQVGINCFIAAAIYVGVGAVSLCQVRLNKRQEYMVT